MTGFDDYHLAVSLKLKVTLLLTICYEILGSYCDSFDFKKMIWDVLLSLSTNILRKIILHTIKL